MNIAAASLEINVSWARSYPEYLRQSVAAFRADHNGMKFTIDTRRNGFITIRAKAI